jgi:DNA-binding NarL/FixJ family response regulator
VTGPAVRVVIADDSPVFLEAAVEVVTATPGFELVGTARSGEAAVELAADARPDLVLMDVRMPGLGGVGAARAIRSAQPEVVVAMLTADSTIPGEAETFPAMKKEALNARTLTDFWRTNGSR